MAQENNTMSLRDLSKKNQEKVYAKNKNEGDERKTAMLSILDEIGLGDNVQKEAENVSESEDFTAEASDVNPTDTEEEQDKQTDNESDDGDVYAVAEEDSEETVKEVVQPEWSREQHSYDEHKISTPSKTPVSRPIFAKPGVLVKTAGYDTEASFKKSESYVSLTFSGGEIGVNLVVNEELIFSTAADADDCTRESIVQDSLNDITLKYLCTKDENNADCAVLTFTRHGHEDVIAGISGGRISDTYCTLQSGAVSFKTCGMSKCTIFDLNAEILTGAKGIKIYF